MAGGVYALRILHFADQRLFRMDVYGPGLNLGRLLTDAPSWIAGMAVLVAGGFCVAALLVVAAARVRPGEVRSVPGVADARARRVVAVAGLVALITAVLLLLHEHAWHSVLAARSAHAALGGHAWIAAVMFALGQFGWVAVALVSVAVARRPWHAWNAWAVAGGWGALFALKGLLHMLLTWSPSRLLGLILQTGAQPSGGPLRLLEAHRQDALATGILQGVLLVCAVALVVAGVRQWRLLAGFAQDAGERAASGRSPAPGWVAVIVVGAALIVAGASPLIARVAVLPSGSLLGFGPAAQLFHEQSRTPTATTPTPIASPSASGGPVVTGVVPGPGQVSSSTGNQGWNGDVVQVNYEPHGTRVVPSKCRLLINGAPVAVPALPVTMSRSTKTVSWSLKKTLGSGKYEFTAILMTSSGGEYRWRWTFSY